ncbi:hypothetical protein [Pseudobacter ginsenosidimutans]|uniref:DUF1795 domain-containing protein n=1 Tax=Pseudobacter ginsenosidimutans TaxID=661488 RepID=A0A4Q7MJR2_9BACT|nr:hypothetical protein [Pseudobacter ginsenosidimutans]QEC45471.1 hypothetical protein FSB84_28650 [Pseudobacter ginsenosidimutans]RZS67002.1 hypothetical protein EV199_5386 [Pseudobacter ginsenosidimutans]
MKKIISKAGYYELMIPDEWTFEQEGNIISVFRENDASEALQISSFAVSKDYEMDLRQELAEYMTEKITKRIEDVEKDIVVNGSVAFIRLIDAEAYREYRMMFEKSVLLLITWNGNYQDAAADQHQLSAITNSIRISGVH